MGRLEVQDLSHSYGRTIRALQGLSLTLRPGVTGVVGVNGAGKTTFIRVVSGGLRPTSGHVRVAGHDLYGLTLPWQLTTGPAALLAGTATGAAVGCLWRGNWAPPVVGITMFLSQRVFLWEGYPELWVIEQATWMMTGARPKANHLIATTTVNLLAFVAGAVAVWWQGGVRRFRGHWRLLIVAACIVGIVLVFMPFVISGDLDTYERIR